MRNDGRAAGGTAWTLMLTDIVALMLAFFVLSFSMRDMIGTERADRPDMAIANGVLAVGPVDGHGAEETPELGVPLALAGNDAAVGQQLSVPEHAAATAPSFAYLAAVVQGDAATPQGAQLRHSDVMLELELSGSLNAGDAAPVDALRRPLLTLAFLARRFDLALAVDLPPQPNVGLEEQLAAAVEMRNWLIAATGIEAPEVTFAALGSGTALAGPASAALRVKQRDEAPDGHRSP